MNDAAGATKDAWVDEAELPCPQCGYDLRATPGDRCPECGLAVDRSVLIRSRIPWVHRRRIGWISAYVRTVWLAVLHPAALGAEAERGADGAAANRFRWITIGLASLGPAALVSTMLALTGADFVQFSVVTNMGVGTGMVELSPLSDFSLPWAAGLTMWGTPLLAAVVALALVSGVGGGWFRPRSLSPARRDAVVPLSRYACASLLFLIVPTLAAGALFALEYSGYNENHRHNPYFTMAVLTLPISLVVVFLFFTMNRLSTFRAATRAGWGRVTLALIVMPIAWALCVAIGLGLIPWLIGLVRIVFASLG